jgi:hypothetical protein
MIDLEIGNIKKAIGFKPIAFFMCTKRLLLCFFSSNYWFLLFIFGISSTA